MEHTGRDDQQRRLFIPKDPTKNTDDGIEQGLRAFITRNVVNEGAEGLDHEEARLDYDSLFPPIPTIRIHVNETQQKR